MARPTQAQAQWAARLWGSAEAIRTAIGAPLMSSISKRLVAQGLTDAQVPINSSSAHGPSTNI